MVFLSEIYIGKILNFGFCLKFPLLQRYSNKRSNQIGETPMNAQEEVVIDCPACGERICLLVDCCNLRQQYVEDCPVCCAPLLLSLFQDETGEFQLEAQREGD